MLNYEWLVDKIEYIEDMLYYMKKSKDKEEINYSYNECKENLTKIKRYLKKEGGIK